jgi:hypothetical protein
MDRTNKNAVLKLVAESLAAYSKKLPDAGPLLDSWWNELHAFPLPVIAESFAAYKDESEFVPTPAAIAKRCKTMDGRPGAEEAWAMIPMDAQTSAVWTDEIAEAWGSAEPLLDVGDRIAARMAFKETYLRLVSRARESGTPIRWTLSQGSDKNGRQAALIEAVRKRRMGLDAALSLLPPDAAQGLLMSLGVKQHPWLRCLVRVDGGRKVIRHQSTKGRGP